MQLPGTGQPVRGWNIPKSRCQRAVTRGGRDCVELNVDATIYTSRLRAKEAGK